MIQQLHLLFLEKIKLYYLFNDTLRPYNTVCVIHCLCVLIIHVQSGSDMDLSNRRNVVVEPSIGIERVTRMKE